MRKRIVRSRLKPPSYKLILGTVDVLDNDKLHVDFKPLFECIHIYTALNSLDELKRSYQADRKVCCP